MQCSQECFEGTTTQRLMSCGLLAGSTAPPAVRQRYADRDRLTATDAIRSSSAAAAATPPSPALPACSTVAVAQRCMRESRVLPYNKMHAHLLMQFPAMQFEQHKRSVRTYLQLCEAAQVDPAVGRGGVSGG